MRAVGEQSGQRSWSGNKLYEFQKLEGRVGLRVESLGGAAPQSHRDSTDAL